MAEPDSAVDTEQVTVSPEDDSDFGQIVDQVQPDNSEETSDSPTTEQPASVQSSTNADPDDEGGTLRYGRFTQKMQDLADRERSWDAQRIEQQKVLDDQRVQLTQAIQAPQPQNTQLDVLTQAAQNPNLTPEERAGLQVLAQTQQATEELRLQMAEFRQFQEQMGPQFQQTQQALLGLTQVHQAAESVELRKQGKEAVELFGEQAVRDNIALIEANTKLVNGKTGKSFTVAEVVSMVTGKGIEEATSARSNSRNQKGQFQKSASSNGSTPDVEKTSRTKDDALSDIKGILAGGSP